MTTVSIVMPCYNEAAGIERCIRSLIDTEFDSENWRILVVDGMSSDGTREIVERIAAETGVVELLDNQARLKPIALNIGIKARVSDVVVRVDGHTEYPPRYVARVVAGLQEHGVENFGGVQRPRINRENLIALAISLANSHPVAVGNAMHRSDLSIKVSEVETVYLGCFRRSVFEDVGFFNEALVRTQDREFNLRIVESGGRILMDPSIACLYTPRRQLTSHLSWIAHGAFWLFYASAHTDVKMVRWRNWIPVLFTVYLLCLGPSLVLSSEFALADLLRWIELVPLFLYASLLIGVSIPLAIKHAKPGLLVVFPFCILTTHVAYGCAAIAGAMRAVWHKIQSK